LSGPQDSFSLEASGLVVFGPEKLPEPSKASGKALRKFEKTTGEVKESFEAQRLHA
jgi:Sec-independent protein translocase protein TatA